MKNNIGLNEKALKIKVQGFFFILFIFLFENNNRNDGED